MQHVKEKRRRKEKMFDKKEKNMIIPPCHVEPVETSAFRWMLYNIIREGRLISTISSDVVSNMRQRCMIPVRKGAMTGNTTFRRLAESTSKCNTRQNYNKSLKNSSLGPQFDRSLCRPGPYAWLSRPCSRTVAAS